MSKKQDMEGCSKLGHEMTFHVRPQPISSIEDFSQVIVNREDDITCAVGVFMVGDRVARFSMEDHDACEFSLVLAGYFRLLTGKDLPVDREREKYDEDNAPSYLAQHTVLPSTWSYLLPFHNRAHSINFLMPPPYHSVKQLFNDSASSTAVTATTMSPISSPMKSADNLTGNKVEIMGGNQCVRNMNTTTAANNNHKTQQMMAPNGRSGGHPVPHTLDLDIHNVMAMELLEDAKDSGLSDSSGGGSSSAMYCPASNGLIEARNEEVLRRVAEMQKMVENSEQYLNEHGELIDEEYEIVTKEGYISGIQFRRDGGSAYSPNLSIGGGPIEFVDSDCDSLNSSKVSSNEDAPPPGALKHSDSLVLLAEVINQDLSGITKGLNSISGSNNHQGLDSGVVSQNEWTPKPSTKMNGLNQLLSDLQALGHDCSQSESDSESVHTSSTSPTHKRPPQTQQNKKNLYRTSFGLHSPDGSSIGTEAKNYNLKEYLKQLKEYSKVDSNNQDTDLAAKKLSEIYGFEIGEDTFIEIDPDLIDLRAIPPPQTPDELDALSILNAAPTGFGDGSSSNRSEDSDGDLDKFLANVVIAPPTEKTTPAKELTPEEIMSFIIPPPPNLEELEHKRKSTEIDHDVEKSLYSNSKDIALENQAHVTYNGKTIKNENMAHVIEYATVERKGVFSCCAKSKKEESTSRVCPEPKVFTHVPNDVQVLPPRRCTNSESSSPPARPPKSAELQNQYSPKKQISFNPEVRREVTTPIDKSPYPPVLPPRCDDRSLSPVVSFPPKKPPLPPLASRPILRAAHPLPSPTPQIKTNGSSAARLDGIGSPHLHRNPSAYSDIDSAFNATQPTYQQNRFNGHYRSNSDCPQVCLKNPSSNNKPQLSLLCSPQMSRKFNNSPTPVDKLITKNGYVIDAEALLAKTDVAMAGLLVKLDQVAAQCTVAQAAGGGSNINEVKFQRAREELTEQTLCLVTASKLLVVAMSDMTLSTLPEHLTLCLTVIRRITELTQDMTMHTSSPLQTRNIVLKVHDVSSSFRELVQVQIGPLGAGQLALQAECLANVLATLLRSLRVFSP